MGKTEKDVFTYIRKCLDKGYSFKKIESGLIKAGYRKKVAEGVILKYKHKSHFLQWFAVGCLVVLFIGSMFITGSGIVGMATVEFVRGFSDDLNLIIDVDSEYSWFPDFKGDIASVAITGNYVNGRYAKVFIENSEERILIFDSTSDNYKVSKVRSNLVDDDIIHFDKVCEDSCFLGLNESNYNLIFEVDEGELEIESVSYDVKTIEKNVPQWTDIPLINVNLGKEARINLSSFFVYEKYREYGYLSADDGINIFINGETAIISPREEGDFFIYFIAKMDKTEMVSNLIKVSTKGNMSEGVIEGSVKSYEEDRKENYWLIIILIVAVILSIIVILFMLRKNKEDLAIQIDSMSRKKIGKDVRKYERTKRSAKKDDKMLKEAEKEIEKLESRIASSNMRKFEKLEEKFKNTKSKKQKEELYKELRKVYSKLVKERMPAKQKMELYKNMKKYFKKIS